MRFLCLCGAYGSSDKFQVQLAPLVNELSSDNTAELHFIHGPVQAFPPEGFEEFFGLAPYYRFIEPPKMPEVEGAEDVEGVEGVEGGGGGGGKGKGGGDVLERIRNFPAGATSEDQMRELMKGDPGAAPLPADGNYGENESAKAALEYLYDIMEKDGPFEGIIGYSEGATVAATLVLHEQRRFETEGRPPMIKLALFFAGWPPMTPDLNTIVLADETDLTINIPTCHVIGSLDPYLAGSIALYNICDMDTAYLFDHAKGHTLPRDKDTVRELGDVLRLMIQNLDSA